MKVLLTSWLSYLVIVQIILVTTVDANNQSYKVLKFGVTTGDYIRFKPNMQPFSDAFSICTWIRKLKVGTDKNWISYAASNYLENEIVIRDDGSYNGIFQSYSTNVEGAAGISYGVWYHYCMCWSLSSRTATIYHHGRQTGSVSTPSGRRLTANGYLVLGQEQDSYGGRFDSGQLFGGELYKLNVFSKKLSSSEVSEMYSAGRCSDIEKKHDNTRQLKWEQILLQPRTGNVRAIVTCAVERKLELVEGQLNECRRELEAIQTDLRDTKDSKEGISVQLNQTMVSLNKKSNELKEVEVNLEETGQRLNQTLIELENTKSSLTESETVAANVSRELNMTKTELGLTKADLKETVEELEEIKEAQSENNCFRAADSSHWDLLYTRCYFNTVLSEEKLGMLNRIWEKLEYFKGITLTEGLIEFLKTFHDGQDGCDV